MLCGASESEPLLLLADHALDSKADSELAGVEVIPSKLGPRTIDLKKIKLISVQLILVDAFLTSETGAPRADLLSSKKIHLLLSSSMLLLI